MWFIFSPYPYWFYLIYHLSIYLPAYYLPDIYLSTYWFIYRQQIISLQNSPLYLISSLPYPPLPYLSFDFSLIGKALFILSFQHFQVILLYIFLPVYNMCFLFWSNSKRFLYLIHTFVLFIFINMTDMFNLNYIFFPFWGNVYYIFLDDSFCFLFLLSYLFLITLLPLLLARRKKRAKT